MQEFCVSWSILFLIDPIAGIVILNPFFHVDYEGTLHFWHIFILNFLSTHAPLEIVTNISKKGQTFSFQNKTRIEQA